MTFYFTSITTNYFAKARVLCKTLKKYNNDVKYLVAVSDVIPNEISLTDEPFDYIFSTRELSCIDNMDIFYFKHNITELCTAVKPMVADYIFSTYNADKVIYLDPDIAVFDSLSELESYLDKYSMIFTPHQLIPEKHDIYVRENEILFLKRGTNNLGFFGVKNDKEGLAFIKWWSDRLMQYCFDDKIGVLNELMLDGILGLFTDQKWIDLVPSFFDNYYLIKHPGYNVSTWNLSGRKVHYDGKKYFVNDKPLYFFHFSGFDSGAHRNELEKSLSYYPYNEDVKKLSMWYENKLKENEEEKYKNIEFFYTKYSTGETISEIDRKLLHIRKDIHHLIKNPYKTDEEFSFYDWVRNEYPQYYRKDKKINDNLIVEGNELKNQRSFRYTKSFQNFTAFIKRHKVLYIFAKGILSIKRVGVKITCKKIISYIRRSILSYKNNSINYESEYQENIDFQNDEPKVKTIAFYLPQFHTIPENNNWWGKGFTEWTNTQKVKPLFEGHYQPREPHKDFGYYDLTNVTTIKKQAVLAKQHGIYGFCFYLYWFSGKQLLEKPLDIFLAHPEININFCLCWANENWTKRWDGLDDEILMRQNYTDDDPIKFIEDIQKYIVDERYIKIDDCPIILVYNPGDILNVKNVFVKWRKYAEKIGIGKIKILICETFNNNSKTLNIYDVVDGSVEFPPHNVFLVIANKLKHLVNFGCVYDYKMVVSELINKNKREEAVNEKSDNIPFYRTCMLGWDNTPRRKNGWTIFAGFSLKSFFDWVSLLVYEAQKTSKSFIFVNAWNEWSEGTYLEPDKKYGYANINTFSKAIYGLPFFIGKPILKWKYKKINKRYLNKEDIKICVQVHLYDIELIDEIIININNIPFLFCCYISTDTDEKQNIIYREFTKNCKNAHKIYVKRFDNRGRDVAPFIEQMENEIDKYEIILHIHSKKSRANDEYRDKWRKYLFKHLLGSTENIYRIFGEFIKNKKLGLIFPKSFSPIKSWLIWGGDVEQGKNNVQNFLKRIDSEMELGDKPEFAAGDMFWARTKAIRKAFCSGIKQEDFPIENGQIDMTLAHAVERSWVYIAQHEGYTFKQMNQIDLLEEF